MYWNFWVMFSHPIFIVGFISWFLAQFFKIFTGGKIRLKKFFDSGGMPSSHTSVTVGVCTTCGILYGFDSPYFLIAFVFSGIVMYDAAHVRLETGRQAEIINNLVEFVQEHNEFDADQLREIIGHEPFEVICGAILAICVASIYCGAIM